MIIILSYVACMYRNGVKEDLNDNLEFVTILKYHLDYAVILIIVPVFKTYLETSGFEFYIQRTINCNCHYLNQ